MDELTFVQKHIYPWSGNSDLSLLLCDQGARSRNSVLIVRGRAVEYSIFVIDRKRGERERLRFIKIN